MDIDFYESNLENMAKTHGIGNGNTGRYTTRMHEEGIRAGMLRLRQLQSQLKLPSYPSSPLVDDDDTMRVGTEGSPNLT